MCGAELEGFGQSLLIVFPYIHSHFRHATTRVLTTVVLTAHQGSFAMPRHQLQPI